MESSSIARLQPKNVIKNPKINVPKIPASAEIDPIHDNCSFVSGPVFNGVFSDKSIGNAGDSQP